MRDVQRILQVALIDRQIRINQNELSLQRDEFESDEEEQDKG